VKPIGRPVAVLPPVVVLSLALIAVAACGTKATNARCVRSSAEGTSAAPSNASASWPTYHRDLRRRGFDPAIRRLGHVRRAWTACVDGKVYAEPLVAGNRVIVATENNSVYALDARTGRVEWRAHIGTPVDGSSLLCGNIDPSGITSTPAIDRERGLVYAVAFLRPAHHVLVAVRLASGRVRWRRDIDPPGADPEVHQQRAALALSHGRVYVSYGGLYGDCGEYHGWVVAAQAARPTSAPLTYRVPTEREGGIWAPSGPAVAGNGDVLVATGNGSSTSSFDFGNAVIRLSPTLQRRAFFAPRDSTDLNLGDVDLGSTGPLLLPGERSFAIGKSGDGYLLGSNLGGIEGELHSQRVCNAAYGGLAFAGGRIYVPCTNGLFALELTGNSYRALWHGPSFNAGPPIIANGAVWTVDIDNALLYALSPRSGQVRYRARLGRVEHLVTPSASGRHVYVGAANRIIAFENR
jgi:outer membrane protein assembly factor BamB